MDQNLEKIIKDTNEILKKLNNSFNSFIKSFTNSEKNFSRTIRKTTNSVDDLNESISDVIENNKKLSSSAIRTARKVVDGINDFSSNLKRGFSRIDSAIDFFADNLGRNVAFFVGGTLGGRLFQYFDESIKEYRKVFDIGENFGGSFIKFNIAASTAGLTLEQFSELVKESSSVIKILGTENFVNLNLAMRKSLMEFGSFGFTLDQINEFSSEFLETQRLVGIIYNKSQESLTKEFTELAKNTSLLSRVTGRSARDIMNSGNQTVRNAFTFMNTIAGLPEEMRNRIMVQYQNLSGALSSIFGKDIGDKLTEAIDIGAASGNIMLGLKEVFGDKLAAILANVSGGEIINQIQLMMEKLTSGNIDDVNQEVLEIIKLFEKNKEIIIQQSNALRLQGKEINQFMASLSSFSRNAQVYRENMEKEMNRQDSIMDKTTMSLMNISQNIGMIFGNLLTVVNETLKPVMDLIMPKIYNGVVFIENITRRFAETIKDMSETSKQMVSFGIIFGGLLAGFKSLSFLVSTLLLPFRTLRSVLNYINSRNISATASLGAGGSSGGILGKLGGTFGKLSFLRFLGPVTPVGLGLTAASIFGPMLYNYLMEENENGENKFSKIFDKISNLYVSLESKISKMIDSVGNYFSSTYESLSSEIKKFFEEKIPNILENTLSEVKKISIYVYTLVSKIINEDIPKIFNDSVRFITNTIPEFINKNLKEIENAIKSFEIKEKIERVGEEIRTILNDLPNLFSNMIDSFYEKTGLKNLFGFLRRNILSNISIPNFSTSNIINVSPDVQARGEYESFLDSVAPSTQTNIPTNIANEIQGTEQRRNEPPPNQRTIFRRGTIEDNFTVNNYPFLNFPSQTNNQINSNDLIFRNNLEENNSLQREQLEVLRELSDYLRENNRNTRLGR